MDKGYLCTNTHAGKWLSTPSFSFLNYSPTLSENVKALGSIYNQLVLRGINVLDIFIVFAERNGAWMPENPFHPNWSVKSRRFGMKVMLLHKVLWLLHIMCQKRFQSWKYRSINLNRSIHRNQTFLYYKGKKILQENPLTSVWTWPSSARGSSAPKQFISQAAVLQKQMWTLCRARPHSSPRVFLSFLVSNLGALTPAVQPLINVICLGLHTDHGTRKEESSLPSWIITVQSSFLH